MNQHTHAASGRLTATALLTDLGIDPAPLRQPRTSGKRVGRPSFIVHEGGGGRVLDGRRNNSLMSMAGLLRRLGGDYQSIKPALHAVNLALFQPPLPDDEVDRVVQSACRYVQGNPRQTDLRLHDEGNARRFVDFFGHEIRYVAEMKKWLIWNGRYWRLDVENAVLERAKKSADLIAAEAMAVSDNDVKDAIFRHARASHQEPRLRAMVKLAESDAAVVIRIAALDRDPFLLPVENGVLDLRTGTLREHRPDDLITRIAPVVFDPRAKCPTWWRFLTRVIRTQHRGRSRCDRELVELLRRLLGCCLTGDANAQMLFFLYGLGANGKSTFLNVVKALLGPDYAKTAAYETLTFKKGGRGATNDLARLRGARAVLTSEIEDGAQLDESLVKQLTGGEAITARFLYAEFFEFLPEFKILMAGNHKPVIRGDDDGIWRRLQLIPFTETIPEAERDPHLPAKLLAELTGILNWALQGCRDWQRKGLRPTARMRAAIQEYRSDSDLIGQWVLDCCDEGAGKTVGAMDAYTSYKFWAFLNGLKPMTNATFGKNLKERYAWQKQRQTECVRRNCNRVVAALGRGCGGCGGLALVSAKSLYEILYR